MTSPKRLSSIPAGALLLCALLRWSTAATVDTVIVGDGTPGPYVVGRAFVDSSTLRVTFVDSTNHVALPFAFVPTVDGIMFSQPVDSGALVRVAYATMYQGVSRTYALYGRSVVDTSDTIVKANLVVPTSRLSSIGGEDLAVSGYKSIGVTVGNQGQTSLEQAMDITISGQVADHTELRAHLSDQGSSLEGTTRELSEIDMIYVSLLNPKFEVTVGDQYLGWTPGGLLSGEKKVKGISAGVTPRALSVKAFGALTGGAYAVQNLRGRTGLQGPYALTGASGLEAVTPISGTVTVWINGARLAEGEEKDYLVDYDFGSITFTPRVALKEDDIIRVAYEYKVFDYQRSLVGTQLAWAARDSLFSVGGTFWNEADNVNHPIDLTLEESDLDSLRAHGDRPYFKAMMFRALDPTKVDSTATYTGVYALGRDSIGRQVFVWQDTIRVRTNLVAPSFRQVTPGTGEYRDSTVCPNGPCYPIYRFVGAGGNYSASSPLSAPARTSAGELRASLRPLSWLRADIDVAGQDNDKNTLSTRDDRDNRAAATRESLLLGQKRYDRRSVWLLATHRFSSERFSSDAFSATDRRAQWNDTSLNQTAANVHAWDASLGGTLASNRFTEFSYGQLRRNDTLATDKFSSATSARFAEHLTATLDGNLFRHLDDTAASLSRRDRIGLALDLAKTSYTMQAGDDWWWGASQPGRGQASGAVGFRFKPLLLEEGLTYASHRSGDRDLLSPDTGHAFSWSQSLSKQILPSWRLTGSSTYRELSAIHPLRSESAWSALVESEETASSWGFTSAQKYSLSSEKASSYILEPRYVGPGLGTHTLDTTGSGDRYVPKTGGEYIVREREYTDLSADRRVRKSSADLSWSLYPRSRGLKGILGDLDWRGSGAIEEHVLQRDRVTARSSIPGYLSLSRGPDDSLVSYANIFYRQSVDWEPRAVAGLHAEAFVRPSVRVQRDYREQGAEWGGGLDKTWARWFVGGETRFLNLRHKGINGSGTSFILKDQSVELTQKRQLPEDFELYVKEAVGRAVKDDSIGPYYRLTPGVTWRPVDRGWGEASYTFSNVDLSTLDYRIARGAPSGISHTIDVMADIRFGDHFSANVAYRGEMVRPRGHADYNPGLHVVSVGVKAFL